MVFPEFIETCRDHIKKTTKVLPAYEIFEQKCLKIDSLALVEYALDLRAQGCTINLLGKNQKHRRTQAFLGNWLDSKAKVCNWDAINDYANEVDAVCCGADGGCRAFTCSTTMYVCIMCLMVDLALFFM